MNPAQKQLPFPPDFFSSQGPARHPMLKLPLVYSKPPRPRIDLHRPLLFPQPNYMQRSQSTKQLPIKLRIPSTKVSPRNGSLPLLKPRLHFPLSKQHNRGNSFFEKKMTKGSEMNVTFGGGQKMLKVASQIHLFKDEK